MIPHVLIFRRRKTQALEWNRHPHHKAAAGHLAPRIPHRVERRIEISIHLLARRFGPDRIPLHAQRRGLEGIGPPPVVKRIEHHLDLVVVVNILAHRHARPHFLRIVEAHEHDVEIFLVVAQVGFRLL